MDKNFFDRRRFLRFAGLAFGAVAVAVLPACGSEEPVAEPGNGGNTAAETRYELVQRMQERGHAILGFVDSPPTTMVRNGEPTGFNVDITMAILEKYGITEAKAFQSDFPGIIPGLQSGQMDIAVPGLLITAERCETLAMSAATNVLVYSFAVPPGNPNELTAVEDFEGTDLVLALEKATTQERIAREILPPERILTVSGRQDGADAVRIGRADAYMAPVDALTQVLEAAGEPLDLAGPVEDMPKIGAAIAFREEDAAFAEAFREDFEELRESGKYAEIAEEYGMDPTLIEMDDVQLTC